jgi:hypothetical protein
MASVVRLATNDDRGGPPSRRPALDARRWVLLDRFDAEGLGIRILERTHGIEQVTGDLLERRCAAEGFAQGRGGGRGGDGAGGEAGEEGLVVVDEDRAVLQQGTAVAPLGAADELARADHELALDRRLEAGRVAGEGRAAGGGGELRGGAERLERVQQDAVDAGVAGAQVGVGGGGDAVGDFAVVEQRASAGGAADDLDAEVAGAGGIVDAGGGLVAAEGERGSGPGVDAEDGLAGTRGAAEEGLVERHVVGGGEGGRGEEAPGHHGKLRDASDGARPRVNLCRDFSSGNAPAGSRWRRHRPCRRAGPRR